MVAFLGDVMLRRFVPALLLSSGALLAAVVPARADPTPPYKDVCTFIADQESRNRWPTAAPGSDGIFPRPQANPFLSNDFVRVGYFDVDGDGIPEWVTNQESTGTMGGDAYSFTLSSQPANPPPLPDKINEAVIKSLPPALADFYSMNGPIGFGEAWLPYGGRFYDVEFSDEGGAFVLDAMKYDIGGARRFACIFQNDVTEENWTSMFPPGEFKQDAAKLCPDNDKAWKPEEIAPTERLPADVSARIPDFPVLGANGVPACRYEDPDSACKDVWHSDFDNDGHIDRLLKMIAESGAGRGCDLEFFQLLTPDNKIATGTKQDLLFRIQHVDIKDVYPVRPCQIAFHWQKAGGQVVMRRTSQEQHPRTTTTLVDDLWIARGGRTARLCYAMFKVTPRIAYDAFDVKR